MNRICRNRVDCRPQVGAGGVDAGDAALLGTDGSGVPGGGDFPIQNLSSEDDDPVVYVGGSWGDPGGGERPTDPFGPDGGSPRGNYVANGCNQTFTSTISQEHADLQAQVAAAICSLSGGGGGGGGGGGSDGTGPDGDGGDGDSGGGGSNDPDGGNPGGGGSPFGPGPGGGGGGGTGGPTGGGKPTPKVFVNEVQTCSVACPGGGTFEYEVPAGTFAASTQEAANAQAKAYACEKANLEKLCVTVVGFDAVTCFGSSCSARVTLASPPTKPVWWNVSSGAVPPGLELIDRGDYADFSGFPISTGLYEFVVQATTSTGQVAGQAACKLRVIGMSGSNAPAGTVDEAYAHTLDVSGGIGESTFALSGGGAIPPGLTLAANGHITGTPTTAGDYDFEVGFTNGGTTCYAMVHLDIVEISSCVFSDPSWGEPIISATDPEVQEGSMTADGSTWEAYSRNCTVSIVGEFIYSDIANTSYRFSMDVSHYSANPPGGANIVFQMVLNDEETGADFITHTWDSESGDGHIEFDGIFPEWLTQGTGTIQIQIQTGTFIPGEIEEHVTVTNGELCGL